MLLVISQEVLCRILSFCLKPRFASIVVAVSRYLRQTVVLPLSWVSSRVIADSHMSDYQLFCLGRILLLADSVTMHASEAQSGLLLNCNLRLFWRGRYPYFWQRNRWIMPIGMGMDRCFVQSKPSLLTSLSCLLSWVGELRGFYIGLTSAVSSRRLTTAALHGARRRDREVFFVAACCASLKRRRLQFVRRHGRWLFNRQQVGLEAALDISPEIRMYGRVQSLQIRLERLPQQIIMTFGRKTIVSPIMNSAEHIHGFPSLLRLGIMFFPGAIVHPRVLVEPIPSILQTFPCTLRAHCVVCDQGLCVNTTLCNRCFHFYCNTHGGSCTECFFEGCGFCIASHTHVQRLRVH